MELAGTRSLILTCLGHSLLQNQFASECSLAACRWQPSPQRGGILTTTTKITANIKARSYDQAFILVEHLAMMLHPLTEEFKRWYGIIGDDFRRYKQEMNVTDETYRPLGLAP